MVAVSVVALNSEDLQVTDPTKDLYVPVSSFRVMSGVSAPVTPSMSSLFPGKKPSPGTRQSQGMQYELALAGKAAAAAADIVTSSTVCCMGPKFVFVLMIVLMRNWLKCP